MANDLPCGFNDRDRYNSFLIELSKTLKYPCGRRVINQLIGICGIYEAGNNFSNQMEAFKNGQRNIGLQLLAAIMDIDGGRTYTSVLSEYWKTSHSDTILDKSEDL